MADAFGRSPLIEPVAITGLGVVCALGHDRRAVSLACRAGRRSFAPIRRFDAAGFRVNLAAEVEPLDYRSRLGAAAVRHTSQTDRFALWAAAEALDQARLDPGARADAAVFVGASSGGMAEMEAIAQADVGRLRPDLVWSYPVWATARALGRHLHLGGPRVTTMTACSSSAHALGIAMQRVRRGEIPVAVAGGSEALCRLTLAGFGALGILDPEGTRPFSEDRKGITLGEGAAFFVLERKDHALARGAEVLAWIVGYGASADAHHMVHPREDGLAAHRAMAEALADAGLTPADIDVVNAHGTGTVQNDAAEAATLARLFGDHPFTLSSSKSMVGHTLGAGGAIEAALSVLGMMDGYVPPNPGTRAPINVAPGVLAVDAAPRAPRRVLSTSFAFGGNNAALVLAARELPSVPAERPFQAVGICGAAMSSPLGTAHHPEDLVRLLDGDPSGARDGIGASGADRGRELVGLDATAVLGARTVRRMDPLSAAVTALVALAAESAGFSPEPEEGIGFGTSFGALQATRGFLERLFAKGASLVNPLDFPNLVHNAAAGYAAIHREARGYSVTTCQEELAGDEAVKVLWERLREGRLPRALCAGGDLHWPGLDAGYSQLARFVDVPTRFSSGVGALALEPVAASRAAGRRVWAELVASRGAGSTGGLAGACRAVLAGGPSPDLWLTSSATARQCQSEDAAAQSCGLMAVPRINVRERLAQAGGFGVAAIALAAAHIAQGRAQRVLVTSLTLDGCAHATLLAAT